MSVASCKLHSEKDSIFFCCFRFFILNNYQLNFKFSSIAFSFRFRWQKYFESVSFRWLTFGFRLRWQKSFESVSVSVAKIFWIGFGFGGWLSVSVSHRNRKPLDIDKIREGNFGPPKWIFYQIWGCWVLCHFSSMFIKTERTWLQTCSKYSKGPPRSRFSNAPTFVTIRHIEIKWCKEDEKRRPDAPFEYHFFK